MSSLPQPIKKLEEIIERNKRILAEELNNNTLKIKGHTAKPLKEKPVNLAFINLIKNNKIMSVLYRPVVDPNPVHHLSGNDYTLAGHIAVSDNEAIQYVGRNPEGEFQFDVVSGTESAGNRPFNETIERENNEPSAEVVSKKGGEKKGGYIFDFG